MTTTGETHCGGQLRLRRRLRGVRSLMRSTERRLASGVGVADGAEEQLTEAGRLADEAERLSGQDLTAAEDKVDQARRLAAAASERAQENLEWVVVEPPRHSRPRGSLSDLVFDLLFAHDDHWR